MSRAPKTVRRPEPLRSPSEVWYTETTKAALEDAWTIVQSVLAEQAPVTSLNPWIYDPQIGLGIVARTALLRDVFRSETYRDFLFRKVKYESGAWQVNIARQSHYEQLLSAQGLSGQTGKWLSKESPVATLITSNEWRTSLCTGFGGSSRETHVRGLNKWFGPRYRETLRTGGMTAELLFETRFHGPSAIRNFVSFLLTGAYAPGVNTGLLECEAAGSATGVEGARCPLQPATQAVVDRTLSALRSGENRGTPVIAITCEGSYALLTQVAATLVSGLAISGANACYVPVRRTMGKDGVLAGSYQSLVESLHSYIQGLPDIQPKTTSVWTAEETAQRVAEVRAHLAQTPTILLFGGYQHALKPYQAIADYVANEPLSRLLRQLVHPDLGDGAVPSPIGGFRQTFFVVLGDRLPHWATTHLFAHESIEADVQLRNESATVTEMRNSAPAEAEANALREALLRHVLRERRGTTEADCAAIAYILKSLQFEDLASFDTAAPNILGRVFSIFWTVRCPSWQRVLLRTLALSLTGIRLGSVPQILGAYARFRDFLQRAGGHTGESFRPVASDQFRQFVESTSNQAIGILEVYENGKDESLSDPTAHPTQTIVAGAELVLWGAVRRKGIIDPRYTYALRSRLLRSLVLDSKSTPTFEVAVLGRIMCELCLQSYRILCLELSPAARRWPVALRWLVEATFYGINALSHEAAAKQEAERDGSSAHPPLKFTLGELPSHPVSALGFLYFTVFRDLLCAGSVTGLGREFGLGSLEIELLRLFGDPALGAEPGITPDLGRQQETWRPPPIIGKVLEMRGTSRRAVLEHMLALCRVARRACRVELLGETLTAIDRTLGVTLGENPLDEAAILKFKLDHRSMRAASGTPFSISRTLGVRIARTILRSLNQPAASEDVRSLLSAYNEFLTGTERYVNNCREKNLSIDPKEVERIVDAAADELSGLSSDGTVSPNLMSLLERVAESVAHEATEMARQPPDRRLRSVTRAIAFFWLLKALAGRRQRRAPFRESIRVGARIARWNLDLAVLLSDILQPLSHWAARGGHAERFERRVARSARSTLDTFLREQGGDKADHIVSLILESRYARTYSQSLDALIRIEMRGSITHDMRLEPLLRCFGWLRRAEMQMLEISARPTMRVMLIEERIDCALEVLRRCCAKASGESVLFLGIDEAWRPRLYSFVQVLANDILQVVAFRQFLSNYSPGAIQKQCEWDDLLARTLALIDSPNCLWKRPSDGDSLDWDASIDLLGKACHIAADTRQLAWASGTTNRV